MGLAFPPTTLSHRVRRRLGYLLAQQLVAAGEDVVDVPPTLSSRVRVLGWGKAQKNDPNDALPTAVAALRGRRRPDPHVLLSKWGISPGPAPTGYAAA